MPPHTPCTAIRVIHAARPVAFHRVGDPAGCQRRGAPDLRRGSCSAAGSLRRSAEASTQPGWWTCEAHGAPGLMARKDRDEGLCLHRSSPWAPVSHRADPAIEALQLTDFREHNPLASLTAGVANFIARGELQVPEVQNVPRHEQPDLLLLDVLCWDAAAVAEASGLPWASIQHSPIPLPAPEVPPFGPGLRPLRGPLG